MVALDEDMIGLDEDTVIAQGLKVCLGLFCRVSNGKLVGAHFTPETTLSDMDVMMRGLRGLMGGYVNWIAMVAKFQSWAGAASGLTSKHKLAAYFRGKTSYRLPVHYADLTMAPASYDVKCTAGVQSALAWRATPVPSPSVPDRRADVLQLVRTIDAAQAKLGKRVSITHLAPCDGSHQKCVHNKPASLSGFFAMNDAIETITPVTIGRY